MGFKRILAVLLVFVLAVTAASCSKSGDNNKSGNGSSTDANETANTTETTATEEAITTEEVTTTEEVITTTAAGTTATEEITTTEAPTETEAPVIDVEWNIDNNGTLTISGNGRMKDYSSNKGKEAPWYPERDRIKKVIIENGVTSIGSYAFYYCTSLTSITIPDSVTEIGYGAFSECESLTSITIPDSVTSIGSWAFSDTAYYNDKSNWENGVLYIGKHLIKAKTNISGKCTIKAETLTVADNAFSSCESLENITADENCHAFSSVNGVLFNKEKTKLVCFPRGKKISSYTIPDSVKSIGDDAFRSCESITSITIPDSVTSIGDGAFSSCTSLTSINIPDGVTSIGNDAFSGCYSLTSITIPDSVTSIGSWAFDGCDNLTITCPAGSFAETYAKENGIKVNS